MSNRKQLSLFLKSSCAQKETEQKTLYSNSILIYLFSDSLARQNRNSFSNNFLLAFSSRYIVKCKYWLQFSSEYEQITLLLA